MIKTREQFSEAKKIIVENIILLVKNRDLFLQMQGVTINETEKFIVNGVSKDGVEVLNSKKGIADRHSFEKFSTKQLGLVLTALIKEEYEEYE